MGRPITVEVTFLDTARSAASGAEGVVRHADGTLHPFSGWLELLAALEQITGPRPPRCAGHPHPQEH